MLLPFCSLEADPEDQLVASQRNGVEETPLLLTAFMVLFCQGSFAVRVLTLCKGGVLDLRLVPAILQCTAGSNQARLMKRGKVRVGVNAGNNRANLKTDLLVRDRVSGKGGLLHA